MNAATNEFGLKCPIPKCENTDEFSILAEHQLLVVGDQVTHDGSLAWELFHPITCLKCKHEGSVWSFMQDDQTN